MSALAILLAAAALETEWENGLVWRLYGALFAKGLRTALELEGWGCA